MKDRITIKLRLLCLKTSLFSTQMLTLLMYTPWLTHFPIFNLHHYHVWKCLPIFSVPDSEGLLTFIDSSYQFNVNYCLLVFVTCFPRVRWKWKVFFKPQILHPVQIYGQCEEQRFLEHFRYLLGSASKQELLCSKKCCVCTF